MYVVRDSSVHHHSSFFISHFVFFGVYIICMLSIVMNRNCNILIPVVTASSHQHIRLLRTHAAWVAMCVVVFFILLRVKM